LQNLKVLLPALSTVAMVGFNNLKEFAPTSWVWYASGGVASLATIALGILISVQQNNQR
jgi:hypothetical protein